MLSVATEMSRKTHTITVLKSTHSEKPTTFKLSFIRKEEERKRSLLKAFPGKMKVFLKSSFTVLIC